MKNKFLLILFAFVLINSALQLNSMERRLSKASYPVIDGDLTSHFKNLGIRPDSPFTYEDVKVAYKKSKKLKKNNFTKTQLIKDKHIVESLCSIRARLRDSYSKKIISRVNRGIYTQLTYEEKDPIDGLNCTYSVTIYNYKKIFVTFVSTSALTYTLLLCSSWVIK